MTGRVPFHEALTDISAGNSKVPKAKFRKLGPLAVVDQGQRLIAGYTDDLASRVRTDRPVIVFGDHTRSFKYVDFPFAMGADGVKVLHPREGFDPKFLYYYLRSCGIPNLGYSRHFKVLRECDVPAFPIEEQRRIVEVLDRVTAARANRDASLGHWNALAQSIFHDIFGDRRALMCDWPVEPLGLKIDFLTSGSRGWAKYYAERGDKFLRIQNVGRDQLLLDDLAFVDAPLSAEAKRTRVRPGDVLLSITADLGRVAVVPETIGSAYINQHLAIIRSAVLSPRYLAAFLTSSAGQLQIAAKNRAGVKAGLNFDDIRSLQIAVPPLELQGEFAARAYTVDVRSAVVRRALAADDELFASLQSRAFRGEL